MGAEPGEAYVVLGAPEDIDEAELLEIGEGLAAVAAETGTTIAGGDLTRAPVLTLAVTVVGHAPRAEDFVTRAGARPGDVLVVTGELGGAAAGLLLIEDTEVTASAFGVVEPPGRGLPTPPEPPPHRRLGLATADALRRRQLDPTPRLAAGRALAAAAATAMIDISDGLAGDAGHVAAASGVLLAIEAASLPIAPGVAEVAAAADRDVLELAVSGGEDYELLAALAPDRLGAARDALAATGTSLTEIGVVGAAGGSPRAEVRLPGGGVAPSRGFDQLRPRRPR